MTTNCIHCGLPNLRSEGKCEYCGRSLTPFKGARPPRNYRRLIFKSLLRIFGLTLILLFLGYASLITTSEPIRIDEQEQVDQAIDLLGKKGFEKEAFVLRNLVRYRATDNWWNNWVGHQDAYAATNFPFEVVTLYPQFFSDPVDDVERAAVLLHESYHLFGYGEPRAFEGTWRERQRLGWVRETYKATAVWNSVKQSTMRWAPQLFQCGPDGNGDCTESQDQP
jgi:hypothetical protein